MITKELALQLNHRFELWHVTKRNQNGTPLRIRVNGVCKTWKTKPNEFRLPCKYGLYDFVQITQDNASEWALPSAFVLCKMYKTWHFVDNI